MKIIFRTILFVFLMGFITPIAYSEIFDPDKLKDEVLEEKSQEIMKKLRCLVCQNQSIVDSDAGHAKDLRNIVRQRVKAGDNEGQILDYMTSRYGDWVLLQPPFMAATALLWLSPIILLAFGVFIILRHQKKLKKISAPQNLSQDEQDQLKKILDQKNNLEEE